MGSLYYYKIFLSKLKPWLISNFFAISISIVFCWITLFNPFVYNSHRYGDVHFAYILFFAILLFATIIYFFKKYPVVIRVTVLDLLAFLYILLQLCSVLLNSKNTDLPEALLNAGIIFLIYPAIRLLGPQKKYPFTLRIGILLILLIQFVIIANQIISLPSLSANSFLVILGTLGNSGILAMFIVSCTTFFISDANNYQKKLSKKLSYLLKALLVFAAIIILILTKSRTAAIGIIPIVLIFLYQKIKTNNPTALIKLTRWLIPVFVLLTIITIGILATQVKYNSTVGRLLIWKICLINLPSIPIMGIGFGNFPKTYSDWQSAYFDINTNTTEMYVAGIVNNTYNEYLQILIELGLPGIIVFFLLIYKLVQTGISNLAINAPYLSTIVYILISALFSYPFHSIPILFIFWLCAAAISNNDKTLVQIKVLQKPNVFGTLVTATAFIVLLIYTYQFVVKNNRAIKKWNTIKEESYLNQNILLKNYEYLNKTLSYNPLFLYDYADANFQANQYHKSIVLFKRSIDRRMIFDSYIKLGIAYQKLNRSKDAEQVFQYCANILPNRLWPKYLLSNLYLEKGDTLNARKYAILGLKTPIKVQSSESDYLIARLKLNLNILEK